MDHGPGSSPFETSIAAEPHVKALLFGAGGSPSGTSTPTQTTVTSSAPGAIVFGSSVTYTATVTPDITSAFSQHGRLVTSMEFEMNGRDLGTVSVLPNGKAILTTKPPAGFDVITAIFSGGGPEGYASSTGTVTQQALASPPGSSTSGNASACLTSTTVDASPNPQTAGDAVTYTATVLVTDPVCANSQGLLPSFAPGQVRFSVGGTTLGVASLTQNSPTGATATLTTTQPPVGTDTVTATLVNMPAAYGASSGSTQETITPAGTPGTAGQLPEVPWAGALPVVGLVTVGALGVRRRRPQPRTGSPLAAR
jgi:hypothetical protein